MKKILYFVPLLCCLSVASAFANNVTVKVYVDGEPSFNNKGVRIDYYTLGFFSEKYFNVGFFSLGSDSFFEKTEHFSRNINKIHSYISLLGYDKREFDESCKTGVFSSPYPGEIAINNGLGRRREVNWGVDYNIKAEFGKPVKVSCRYINY